MKRVDTTWPTRIVLGAVCGCGGIAILDGLGNALSPDFDGVGGLGIATLVAVTMLAGTILGLVVTALVHGASLRAPLWGRTSGALATAFQGRVLAWIPASLAFAAFVGIGIPLRARLFPRPLAAAAVDTVTLVVGFALFFLVQRRIGRTAGFRLKPRHAGAIIAGLGGLFGGVGLAFRPTLIPSGLWDLVLLGSGVALAFGVALLLPSGKAIFRVALVVCGASVIGGAVGLLGLDRQEALRDEIGSSFRPVSWILETAITWIDFDRDGFSPVFGGGDCDDFRDDVNPDGVEIAGNGVDENCKNGDREPKLPWKLSPSFVPLPEGFRKPSKILLIVIDTVRPDHLGAYGYDRPTSPNIDRFAEQAALFQRAYSVAPTTRIAIPALLTGRSLGEISWDRRVFPFRMLDGNVTVTEVLRDHGFTTGAFVTHRYLGRGWNFTQGFDEVDESQVLDESKYRSLATGKPLARKALGWIEAHSKERFFAWVHFMDPHKNYLRHKEGTAFGDAPVDLYDGEIEYTDQAVGMLLDGLERLGLSEETAVIIMADHGEYLGEHGRTAHGGCVWEEGNLIPLIIRVPGLAPRKVACLVAHTDVAPTILNMVGIDGGERGMSGVSLIPEITEEARCDRKRHVVVEMRYGPRSAPNLRALVGRRWKLVMNVKHGTYRLYDLKKDPGEKRNVAKQKPKTLAKMKKKLMIWSEIYANREIADIRKQSVISELPKRSERYNIQFENGLDLLAVDLGNRTLSRDDPLDAVYFLSTRERIRGECQLVHAFVGPDGEDLHEEGHPPIVGSFPLHLWPVGGIIVDGFSMEVGYPLRRLRGSVELRVGLVCDKKPVPVVSGQVDDEGRAKIGKLMVE